ncbi:MAG TPA: FmdB family zinc ribbon protein [Candidatus Hydromicrobium sp.]
MPVYSYRCEKCGKIFDKFQKAGCDDVVKCIYCDSSTSRLFSAVGIIFKGSGFYSTDYKSSSKNLNSSSTPIDKEKDTKKFEGKSSGKKEISTVPKKNT